ncbi:hypothetical protein K458DRAFT_385050 [Lentithecium fluviatile CBS 122367]|uniref:Cytidyltransferase-like domain-containing protein n=1 Tax=Lentithecium fluviatile CBS 122367 TaxID=1168545 RepID=A0A6G1JE89_9PLEO|nr:hypothetical protein K458DRAFT_385050 [Lentithecium fluviatile CBS 122367]
MAQPPPSPAHLVTYIRRALRSFSNFQYDRHIPIFIPSGRYRAPVLRGGCTNRIVIYSGSFNLPHKGHLQTLCQSLHRMKGSLNIVAAFTFCIYEDFEDFYFNLFEQAAADGFILELVGLSGLGYLKKMKRAILMRLPKD